MKQLLMWTLLAVLTAGQGADRAEVQLQAAIKKEAFDGDLKGAIEQYQKLANSSNRAVAAQALLRMGQCYEKLGDTESRKAYERLVRDFGDQKDLAVQARARLAALGASSVTRGREPFSERVWALPRGLAQGNGRVSPDGRYLAFGGSRLMTHDLVTGQDLQAGSQGFSWPVAYSVSGGQVALSVGDGVLGSTKDNELRVVAVDGTGDRLVTSIPRSMTNPVAWAPNGKHILLARLELKPPKISILLLSLADGSIQTLGSEDIERADLYRIAQNLHYNISPDSRYVTYSIARKKAMVGPIAAWAPIPVVDGQGKSWMPSWTADGRNILFLSDRSGTTDVWMRRVVDGKPEGEAERIMALADSWNPLGFTNDGSLYYEILDEQADVYVADLDPGTGKVVSKPTRVNQRLVGSTQGPPRWSPDGNSLVYRRVTSDDIVIHSTQTGQERELALSEFSKCPGGCGLPIEWFPDNQSLMAGGYRGAPLAFGKVDVRTGATQELFRIPNQTFLSNLTVLSRDGMAIFYVKSALSTPFYRVTMVRRDLASGEEKEVYQNSIRDMGQPRLSQDGRRIAFVVQFPDAPRTEPGALTVTGPITRVLTVVSADGGDPREVVRTKLDIRLVSWTSDGRHMLVAQTDWKSGTDQLWSYPVDGGDPVPTGLNMQIIGAADVHPDGRRIAFVGRTSTHEVWALRNIVPPARKEKQN